MTEAVAAAHVRREAKTRFSRHAGRGITLLNKAGDFTRHVASQIAGHSGVPSLTSRTSISLGLTHPGTEAPIIRRFRPTAGWRLCRPKNQKVSLAGGEPPSV
jgi:hypothetical protein